MMYANRISSSTNCSICLPETRVHPAPISIAVFKVATLPNELYRSPIAGWMHSIEYFVNLGLRHDEIRPGLKMFNFAVMARLRPGVSVERAIAQLDASEAVASKGDPGGALLKADLVPLKAAIVGPAERKLWMLMGGAGLVLLLVCVNLAGLLIAKSSARTHEIGVRTALGAARADLVRQFLIEAVVLSGAGGLLGVGAAYWGVRALTIAAPIEIPRLQSIAIDARVLVFSAAISIGAGIAVSLLPAIQLTRHSVSGVLKGTGGNTSAAHSVSRMHQALAASELMVCAVLLICSVLIARSLAQVLKVNEWGNTARVVTIDLAAPPDHYQDFERRAQLYKRLLDAARNFPSVQAAGITNALPFKGEMWGDSLEFKEAPKPPVETPNANWRMISPQYFTALGLPLIRGRLLSESDSGKHVLLVSESVAKQLPIGMTPVGVHVLWTPPNSSQAIPYEVIGVVADARATPDADAPLTVYVPYWEWPPWEASLVIRTVADPRSVIADVQNLIRRTDREIAIPQAKTLNEILSKAVAPRRFATFLGLVFALSATFLAAIGLYGLTSLTASQRTREIGIRMALGAHRGQIVRMMIWQTIRLSIVGLGCGMACGLAAARLLGAFLYEMKPSDPLTFACVAAGLLVVSLAATYVPARRATTVDPVAALKWE
jgi:predicted permease